MQFLPVRISAILFLGPEAAEPSPRLLAVAKAALRAGFRGFVILLEHVNVFCNPVCRVLVPSEVCHHQATGMWPIIAILHLSLLAFFCL